VSAAPATRSVLLAGGTSEIGLAIAGALGAQGARDAVLAGRDRDGLEAAATRLRAQAFERVETVAVDALSTTGHEAAVDAAFAAVGGIDLAIVAVGILGRDGGTEAAPAGVAGAVEVLAVNTVGAGSLLMWIAERMRAQGHGTIVVLSSVAGVRPRRANPAYGASKAGLDGLAQALADEMRGSGVRFVVVRPGFVRGRMTRGLKAAPFATTPEAVAEATVAGIRSGRRIVWTPPILGPVMTLMRLLPRRIFARIST
jgi:decaprenylphospho-beta-D-erythro-pentofuranosid-2-ulose 2-reductase